MSTANNDDGLDHTINDSEYCKTTDISARLILAILAI